MKCRPNFYHSRRVALSSTACGVCITAKMPNQTHQTRGFMASFLRIRRAKNTIKYYLTQCASSLGWLQINVFFFNSEIKGEFFSQLAKIDFRNFQDQPKNNRRFILFFQYNFLVSTCRKKNLKQPIQAYTHFLYEPAQFKNQSLFSLKKSKIKLKKALYFR